VNTNNVKRNNTARREIQRELEAAMSGNITAGSVVTSVGLFFHFTATYRINHVTGKRMGTFTFVGQNNFIRQPHGLNLSVGIEHAASDALYYAGYSRN